MMFTLSSLLVFQVIKNERRKISLILRENLFSDTILVTANMWIFLPKQFSISLWTTTEGPTVPLWHDLLSTRGQNLQVSPLYPFPHPLHPATTLQTPTASNGSQEHPHFNYISETWYFPLAGHYLLVLDHPVIQSYCWSSLTISDGLLGQNLH